MNKNLLLLNYVFESELEDSAYLEAFNSHIQTLLKWGYVPISQKDVEMFFYEGTDIPNKSFLLSVNWDSIEYVIELQDSINLYSIPLLVFLDSTMLDTNYNKNNCSNVMMKNDINLIELLKLKKNSLFSYGYEINKELDSENKILENKKRMEGLVNQTTTTFYYQGDEYSDDLKIFMREIGSKITYTNCSKSSVKNLDFMDMKRIDINSSDKTFRFWYKIFKSKFLSYNLKFLR